MSDITIEVEHSKEFVLISFNSTKPTWKRQPIEHWTKDLPVKSTEGPLGYRPIVFLLQKRPASCSKFIDVPLQPVG
jgi:hypothetical protein